MVREIERRDALRREALRRAAPPDREGAARDQPRDSWISANAWWCIIPSGACRVMLNLATLRLLDAAITVASEVVVGHRLDGRACRRVVIRDSCAVVPRRSRVMEGFLR